MSILAICSVTDWIRELSGMAPMGILFAITTLGAAIFPYIKRKPVRPCASPGTLKKMRSSARRQSLARSWCASSWVAPGRARSAALRT